MVSGAFEKRYERISGGSEGKGYVVQEDKKEKIKEKELWIT